MTEKRKGNAWEYVRIWSGVLIALAVAVAGIWKFWLKEVVWPGQAPVNLTTSVKVNPTNIVLSSGVGKKFQAVELTITAMNPSTRTVFPQQDFWLVRGHKVDLRRRPFHDSLVIDDQHRIGTGNWHSRIRETQLVAAGRAFAEDSLKPQESVSSTFVFYLPSNLYDILEVEVGLPSTVEEDCMQSQPGEGCVVYKHDISADGSITTSKFRVKEKGLQTRVEHSVRRFLDPKVQEQWSNSLQQMSLPPQTPESIVGFP